MAHQPIHPLLGGGRCGHKATPAQLPAKQPSGILLREFCCTRSRSPARGRCLSITHSFTRGLAPLKTIYASLQGHCASTHQFRACFVEHDRLMLPRVIPGRVRLTHVSVCIRAHARVHVHARVQPQHAQSTHDFQASVESWRLGVQKWSRKARAFTEKSVPHRHFCRCLLKLFAGTPLPTAVACSPKS